MNNAQKMLKHYMAIRMLNAKQLAEKTGFHHNTVLAWLNGKNEPNFFKLRVCLNAMGYDINIQHMAE